MVKVTLDRETFKALASETRLDLLRALDERRKTGSELARELDLNKATVHEHLQVLDTVGLVQKVDEGRKWIYYTLTWQGQKLLHPEQGASFAVLLGLSVAAAGGGFAALGRALGWWWREHALDAGGEVPEEGMAVEAADADNRTMQAAPAIPEDASQGAGSTFFDDGGWLALALLATALLLVGLAWWMRRRR